MSAKVIKAPWAPPLKLSRREAFDGARRWDLGCGRLKDRNRRKFFGERLRILRIVLGYTDARMADEIGISLRTYRKWEAGGTVRKWLPLQAFLDHHEVSYNWSLSGDGSNLRPDLGSSNVLI